MDVRNCVFDFCHKLDAKVDDAVVDYLTSFIRDAEADNVDLEETENFFTEFFPTFATLPDEEKHESLWELLQKAQGHQDGEERKEYAGKPKFVKIQDDVEPVKHMQTLSLRETISSEPSSAASTPQHLVNLRAAPLGWAPCCVDMETDGHVVEVLAILWPEGVDFCPDFAAYILHAKGLGRVETAAHWLLDIGPQNLRRQQELWLREAEKEVEAREAAKRAEQEARKKTLAKFSLQPESASAAPKGKGRHGGSLEPWTAADKASAKKGVRYRDGQLVSTRGEKFIIETLGTEWNGGSSGKVYTKGKRGKGVI